MSVVINLLILGGVIALCASKEEKQLQKNLLFVCIAYLGYIAALGLLLMAQQTGYEETFFSLAFKCTLAVSAGFFISFKRLI